MSAGGVTGAGGPASVALISGNLAAAEVEVSPATIRKWVQLGHLTAAGRQGRRLLYRLEDVFAAERAVRRRS
ncbi:helix-turn-helix domain-containing protein [Streptomyces sp. NBC_01317]|uniref:helix-turn-helix domain-containing protein n=1 Tax=Streptomyces sp. NBC_01317 TaxID=2903822 RepID=UPI002E154FF4|nr:helix-turn-helix domain-containing protein [Streptomyces sp. NBC_01317]